MVEFMTQGVGASIQTPEIDDGAVTNAKIADGAITISKLSGAFLALVLG